MRVDEICRRQVQPWSCRAEARQEVEDDMASPMRKGAAVASILESVTDPEIDGLAPEQIAVTLVESLDTVFHGRRVATYVSTPITTGPRFVEWRRHAGRRVPPSDPAFVRAVEAVIASNTAAVRPLIERAETHCAAPVIDPTRLGPVPGWSQLDYHRFWVEVLSRYAVTAVFAEGWNLSNGCALEFAAAVQTGVRTLDAEFASLAPVDGLAMLQRGSAMLRDAGLDDSIMQQAIDQLTRSGLAGGGSSEVDAE